MGRPESPPPKNLAFRAAWTTIRVDGDPESIAGLAILYARFPKTEPAAAAWRIQWREEDCRWGSAVGTEQRRCRLAHAALRPALTALLVTRILAESNPNGILFHANALVHGETGRLLLLLGESGGGKTTLSRTLLDCSGGFRLLCEDLLPFDTHGDSRPIARFWPYPRAATIRGGLGQEGRLPWTTLDGVDKEKTLWIPEGDARVRGPVETDEPVVVLLGRGDDEAGNNERGEGRPTPPIENPDPEMARDITWTTDLPPSAPARLREAGLPLETVELRAGSTRLRYDRALTVGERRREAATLETLDAVVLRMDRNRTEGLPPSEGISRSASILPPLRFPPAPHHRSLIASEGLLRLLGQRVRFEPDADGAAARMLFRLGPLFANARFHAVTPGGTPAETAELLTCLVRS